MVSSFWSGVSHILVAEPGPGNGGKPSSALRSSHRLATWLPDLPRLAQAACVMAIAARPTPENNTRKHPVWAAANRWRASGRQRAILTARYGAPRRHGPRRRTR